jgi:hypothetical protein
LTIPSGTIIKEYFKNWYTNSAIDNTMYSIIIHRGWSIHIFGYCANSKYGGFYLIAYDIISVNGVNKPKYPEMELFAVINNANWIFGDNITG